MGVNYYVPCDKMLSLILDVGGNMMADNKSSKNEDLSNEILSQIEHEEMHKKNLAHVHIRNHGQVTVRVATEEEKKNHIRFIDNETDGAEHHDHHHGHDHGHGHVHDEVHTKKILNRFSRAIGHMERIKIMVENGNDCSEVLIQLSAVKSAVNNIGRELLKEHVAHCIVDSVEEGDSHAIEMLNSALDQFMK